MAAAGTVKRMNATMWFLQKNLIDVTVTTGWKFALITSTYDSIAETQANPRFGTAPFDTEVTAGGNYSAGGIALTTNAKVIGDVEPDGILELDLNLTSHPSGIISLLRNASNPSGAKTGVFYYDAGTDPVIGIVELTADAGTTAIDLVNKDLEYTPDDAGTAGRIMVLSMV